MSTPIETIIAKHSAPPAAESSENENQILTETGFYWRETDGIKVLICKALEEKGFANGFSTRTGGVSAFPENSLNLAGFDEDTEENIFENRRRFLKVFGGNYKLSTVWQIHGDGVKIVAGETDIENTEEKYDALASCLENLLIGVKTADCVPVLLGDMQTKAYAAVHAGWRGTVESIVSKTVEKMREVFKTKAENLICAIGPAAGCENYEIGRDVTDAFAKNFPDSEKYFQKTRDGHALVNLHLANRDQLLNAGVTAENIFTAPFCTMDRNDLFFSYRLEKSKFGKTGRLLSVIGRKN